MPEVKKQRMGIDKFCQIFERYSFEDKCFVLGRLQSIYKEHGEDLRKKLQTDLQDLENKIS